MTFSIIIPTMWKSELLMHMLEEYEKEEMVGEVIIIDNAPKSRFDVTRFTKVALYTKGENIYVNPAWNWGVELAKYEIILANDDIEIDDISVVLKLIANSDYDIVGVRIEELGTPFIRRRKSFPQRSYGSFMYVRHYIPIPEQLKIWYGDRLLFYNSKKRGILREGGFHTKKSTTINSNVRHFRRKIGKQDKIEFHKLNYRSPYRKPIQTSNQSSPTSK